VRKVVIPKPNQYSVKTIPEFDFDAFRQYRNQLYLKQHFNFVSSFEIVFLKEKSCFKEPTNTQIKTI